MPGEDTASEISISDYVKDLENKLTEIHEVGRRNLKKAAIYRKKQYDVKANRRSFKEGDAVWLYDPVRKVGVCSKLTPIWKGPYCIVRRLDDLTYLLKKSPRHLPKVFHIDRLMPYKGVNIPRWFQNERTSQ